MLSKLTLGNIFRISSLFTINVIAAIYMSNFFAILIFAISILLVIVTMIMYHIESKILESKVNEVTYYVEKHGNDIFTSMPIGIVAVSSSGIINWNNKFMKSIVGEELTLNHIENFFPKILSKLENKQSCNAEYEGKRYHVLRSEGALYFFENTQYFEIVEKYAKEKLVMGFVYVDNYDDFFYSLPEQKANEIVLNISKLINVWCSQNDIFIRKYSSGKYLMVLSVKTLEDLKKTKFDILDKIRLYGVSEKLPLTLSMSFATSEGSPSKVGEIALEGLDLVLSRGGDQVVVKTEENKNAFYGGKTDAFEKRNRVKARMYSQSIGNLIKNSADIIIMTHKNPDFDAIGALVGMYKFSKSFEKKVYTVINDLELNTSTLKLMNELKTSEFYNSIVSVEKAAAVLSKESLLIIVDTNRTSLVESMRLIDKAKNIVVIDHHRRGDEFISDPIVAYVEPYASSSSELVTELITFQSNKVNVTAIEATAMLAGIIVDTKRFVYRTGNRTFEAASKLKAWGADTILIQDLLKEALENVFIKNEMISNIKIIGNNCAVTYLSENRQITRELLAQTANEILDIENVNASFVLAFTKENVLSISARSLGDVNVQMIAEKFDGGGHMSAAAAQIINGNMCEVYNQLIEYIGGIEK